MPRPLPKVLHQKRQAPPSRAELEEQLEDALLHYETALRSFAGGLPVDWEWVAFQMACCVAPGGGAAGWEALTAALDRLGDRLAPTDVPAPAHRPKYTRHP